MMNTGREGSHLALCPHPTGGGTIAGGGGGGGGERCLSVSLSLLPAVVVQQHGATVVES